jgi:hypothetical protein
LTKLPGLLPIHALHRQIVALEIARILLHDLPILPLGHLVFPHPEALGQRYLVLGFASISLRFTRRTAHHELARWYPRQLQLNPFDAAQGRFAAQVKRQVFSGPSAPADDFRRTDDLGVEIRGPG